ncbi:hypothetical protein B296_00010896 [Ensete ventricosum]|uniref:Uncharacterized protein n=1 Tax=Ensete ventricosum TaxID=4639 RepID=A0A427AGV9_ENSVE|nr:hypothetical protein B296_00010896 [Ensete ventricosum]
MAVHTLAPCLCADLLTVRLGHTRGNDGVTHGLFLLMSRKMRYLVNGSLLLFYVVLSSFSETFLLQAGRFSGAGRHGSGKMMMVLLKTAQHSHMTPHRRANLSVDRKAVERGKEWNSR